MSDEKIADVRESHAFTYSHRIVFDGCGASRTRRRKRMGVRSSALRVLVQSILAGRPRLSPANDAPDLRDEKTGL